MQNIIAEHEIRNISCAAQDPEDLCTFAYITKDLQTSHHYCHVFSTVDVVMDTLRILFFFSYISIILIAMFVSALIDIRVMSSMLYIGI